MGESSHIVSYEALLNLANTIEDLEEEIHTTAKAKNDVDNRLTKLRKKTQHQVREIRELRGERRSGNLGIYSSSSMNTRRIGLSEDTPPENSPTSTSTLKRKASTEVKDDMVVRKKSKKKYQASQPNPVDSLPVPTARPTTSCLKPPFWVFFESLPELSLSLSPRSLLFTTNQHATQTPWYQGLIMSTARTKPFFPLGKRDRTPAVKMIPCCHPSSTTEHILRSAKQISEMYADYTHTLTERYEQAKKERDSAGEELDAMRREEVGQQGAMEANEKTLQELHIQLRTQLGENAYNKLVESRPFLSKDRPTLPPKIKHIHGDAIKGHIRHRPGPEEAEGSRTPAARAAPKRDKILGGGGHNDKIPEASEIGSGILSNSALLPEFTASRPTTTRSELPHAVPNASSRPERALPQREFGGEGDEGGHELSEAPKQRKDDSQGALAKRNGLGPGRGKDHTVHALVRESGRLGGGKLRFREVVQGSSLLVASSCSGCVVRGDGTGRKSAAHKESINPRKRHRKRSPYLVDFQNHKISPCDPNNIRDTPQRTSRLQTRKKSRARSAVLLCDAGRVLHLHIDGGGVTSVVAEVWDYSLWVRGSPCTGARILISRCEVADLKTKVSERTNGGWEGGVDDAAQAPNIRALDSEGETSSTKSGLEANRAAPGWAVPGSDTPTSGVALLSLAHERKNQLEEESTLKKSASIEDAEAQLSSPADIYAHALTGNLVAVVSIVYHEQRSVVHTQYRTLTPAASRLQCLAVSPPYGRLPVPGDPLVRAAGVLGVYASLGACSARAEPLVLLPAGTCAPTHSLMVDPAGRFGRWLNGLVQPLADTLVSAGAA
ncbi:hypothetical protein FB451DRAFT_1175861 [Mycena latifolia]|nr:hypothetical protein FB451DRAFT_1175861 [Mycena latifolia]